MIFKHTHKSYITKKLPAGLKMIWYFPIICIHLASSLIVTITMPLSSECHQHASCLGANFFLAFQITSYGPLLAKGFVPSMHSKHQDLSCHCSWLNDCIFAQRACTLWSFRTLANCRFILAKAWLTLGIIACSTVPCQGGVLEVEKGIEIY